MNPNDQNSNDGKAPDVDMSFVSKHQDATRDPSLSEDPPVEDPPGNEPPAPGDKPPIPLKAAAGDDDLMSEPPEPNAPRGTPLPNETVSG